MISTNDTICAIATAAGKGAISIVRLSGPQAKDIITKIFTPSKKSKNWTEIGYTLHYGTIHNNKQLVDDVIVSIFTNPQSYTGEDSVEISCHGSLYIQNEILKLLISHGARLATPGEFTQRAFLNGKLDLSQAEAVADLIASGSQASHQLAISQIKGGYAKELQELRHSLLHFLSMMELELDFSEEEVEFANRKELLELANNVKTRITKLVDSFSIGNAVKNGIPVCIVGEPNVGKSTLLNAILNEEKAIVSEIPGTTRDVIEDTVIIGGTTFRFMDTAGIRNTSNQIERLGIDKTFAKIDTASFVLFLVDVSSPLHYIKQNIIAIKQKISADKKLIIVVNKIDVINNKQLQNRFSKDSLNDLAEQDDIIFISAKNKTNITEVIEKLLHEVNYGEITQHDAIVTNIRHFEALQNAQTSIEEVINGINHSISNDLISLELRHVLHHIGLITGSISTDEMLGHIFENFCIGK